MILIYDIYNIIKFLTKVVNKVLSNKDFFFLNEEENNKKSVKIT